MGVHVERGDDRTVRRIMALLVALALLAERAAGRSLPVRLIVLWCVRRAETVAAAFVLEAIGAPPPAILSPSAIGSGPDDALVLAARLRVLAAALGALLPVACFSGGGLARRASAPGRFASVPGRRPGGKTMEPNDTS